MAIYEATQEIRGDLSQLRQDLVGVRAELKQDIGELKDDLAGVRVELGGRLDRVESALGEILARLPERDG